MNTNLKRQFNETVATAMAKEFGISNPMSVPRIVKVTVNSGISAGNKDPKLAETVLETIGRITGQKPVETLAKKSIAAFKIREGMTVGAKATLRGERMYSFLSKLVHVTLARVRDFRGLSLKSVDKNGNLTIGFKEHIAFPEIRPDEVERLHGLEVVITTTAKNHDRGLALFKALGFPFAAPAKGGSASGGK
jgi:large subunit ribosomal protein L5